MRTPALSRILLVLPVLVLLSASPASVRAVTIATNGPSSGSNPSFPGVSLTTVTTGGPWNNLTFNFYDTNGNTEASGDLFILTSAYAGTPTALSAATAGFLAQSVSVIGNVWQFDASVTLNPNTVYFIYTDEGFSHTTGFGNGGDSDFGAEAYFAKSALSNYFSDGGVGGANWDYDLQGLVVPEPSTALLISCGLLGLGAHRRRRKA